MNGLLPVVKRLQGPVLACSQRDDGYPLDAATQIAVDTVADWLQSHTDCEMKVIFCCFDARTAQVYQTKMKTE